MLQLPDWGIGESKEAEYNCVFGDRFGEDIDCCHASSQLRTFAAKAYSILDCSLSGAHGCIGNSSTVQMFLNHILFWKKG